MAVVAAAGGGAADDVAAAGRSISFQLISFLAATTIMIVVVE